MPKNCEDCPLGEESDSLYYSCYPQGWDYTHDSKSGRMPNCPLVEIKPHGDLIDRDALYQSIKESMNECHKWANEIPKDNEMYCRVSQALGTFLECALRAKNAPTIIEKEDGI